MYDPIASVEEISNHYQIKGVNEIDNNLKFDMIIMCVNHNNFKDFNFKKAF